MKFLKFIMGLCTFIVALVLLALAVKGGADPVFYQESHMTRVGGPFESTNSTSRYALVESIVKRGTFFFNDDQASFAAPDLVKHEGKYFSIFTPGISFVAVPFYILGEMFGYQQLFAFFSTILFALGNLFLISYLVRRLTGQTIAGLLAGFIFLFATNAFAYSQTLTQHHGSTFVVLLALATVMGKRTIGKNLLFGLTFGVGLLFDIPNAFMLLPIAFYSAYQHLVIKTTQESVRIGFNFLGLFIIFGFLPFLALFGWYNYQLTGSYTKIGQTIGRSDYLPSGSENVTTQSKIIDPYESTLPFSNRKQISGLYILLISNERGLIYYSPIVLLGLLGMYATYKKTSHKDFVMVGTAVTVMVIILYSMFGDPWGGWSYGGRYMIPAYAILSIFVGTAFVYFKSRIWFFIIFVVLTAYSLWVNSLGVLTTQAIPPKVEAINLLEPIPYTYEYNQRLLQKGMSSSFLFNSHFYKYMNVNQYFYTVFSLTLAFTGLAYMVGLFEKNKEKA